jgi:antibiotic biosynthesis monooxygenase (ABM) superfamily enzyme
MAWIRRSWSPEAADEWTREDYIGIILSVISYFTIAIGVPMAFFGWLGWLLVIVGVVSLLLMVYVIDPKLKAISTEYEKQQKRYLEELDRKIRWED